MNKYEAGSYHTVLFDRYGSKIAVLPGFTTYQGAKLAGQAELQEQTEINSFAVVRIIYNSLDNKYPWEDNNE